MTRIAYHPRLWRKHMLQHHVYADLHLPEIGLTSGESPAEEALWRAAMDGVGIEADLRVEVRRQYQELVAQESTIKTLLKQKDTRTGSPYLQASKLCSLFDRSAREAGVLDHPDFIAARDQLFWNTLIEFGIYYDIFGSGYLKEVVILYRSGNYAKDLAPLPEENRILSREDEDLPPDVVVEVGGYARRALDLYGSGPLTLAGLARAPALGRFAMHRFKNFLRFVVGARLLTLSGDALMEASLAFAQGARLIDQEVSLRLEDLVEGRPLVRHYEDERPEEFEEQVRAVLLRLKTAEGAILQAWADGWLAPEERILLRYLFPHIFGVGERAIGRFLTDAETAKRLCLALRNVAL